MPPISTVPPLPTEHRYMVIEHTLVDGHSMSPAQVLAAREHGEVFCPTCLGKMKIVIGDDGPMGVHTPDNPYGGHEAEDSYSRQSKHLLRDRLKEMFPSATVSMDSRIPEVKTIADIILITPQGGKMAIEFQSQDLTKEEVIARKKAYEEQGILCFWILDSRRLVLAKKGKLLKKATLGPFETALLALNEPLIYLNTKSRQITWVTPHPDARELAFLGEKKLGRVDCLVREYRMSFLRIVKGRWWVETRLDPKAPPLTQLPASLQNKLDKRRAKDS